MNEKKCEFCDKRGLPLLLVRDAVAPVGKRAPLSNDAPIQLSPHSAQYTKRLVRTGYVNVFDEARKRWDVYFVTPDGYYFKLLMPRPGIAPVVPAKPFDCADKGHAELASCVTVSDPKNATKVWIGFSDVLWTDTVRKTNEDAAYRKRHMVEIDIQAAMGGGVQPHARPIAQLPAVVAEYAMQADKAQAALKWSPFPLSPRQAKATALIEAFDSMRPGKGLIVTVPDPAGVAQELAALMKYMTDTFMDAPDRRRNLAADAAIRQLEAAIKRQGEINEIDAAEELANQQLTSNPLGYLLSESQRTRTEKLRNVTVAEATKNANSSWEKYAAKFDNTQRTTWVKTFNEDLSAYDQRFIAPLAQNHVKWMKSPAMANYFECNYDRADLQSGVVYTTVVTGCIAATQDKQACAALYDDWLAGSIDDNKNLVLQSMIFNLKKVADAVKGATTVSLDLRQIPWDNIFAVYTTAVERMSTVVPDVLSRLITQFFGPLARMLGKIVDGTPKFRAGIMALGLVSGHPVVVCEIEGGRKKFREYIIKTLQQTSGQTATQNQLRKAVSDEMKRLGVHGAPMEGTTKKRWIVLADRDLLHRMPSGLRPEERAKWMAESIKTIEQVESLNLERWRQVISSKVCFGVVAGLLQAFCMTKLIADEEKALASSSLDAKMRLYAGIAAVAATTADVVGNLIEKRAAQGLRYGQGVLTTLGGKLSFVASRAAIVAGLFVAGLDVMQAMEARREGQTGLAILYGASAILGGLATIAIASAAILGAAAVPVIGILVALVIGVAIIIENVKDNPVQDWLERCPWGKLPASERYADMAAEQADLIQALK